MPSATSYQVLFDVINDSHDYATVQLLRDYRSPSAPVVLLPPQESISLVLDAGAIYQYAVKMRTKVANISVRVWRDYECTIVPLFASAPPSWSRPPPAPSNGVAVDRVWKDNRITMTTWND